MSKILIRSLSIFLLTLLVLIGLIPFFLSTDRGSTFLLGLVNNRIPGSIHAEDINLSWFGTQQIKAASLQDAQSTPIFTVKNIEVESSLVSLLINFEDFNELKVENANVKIIQDEKGITNLQDALGFSTQSKDNLNSPVYVNDVNINISNRNDKKLVALATGKTKQNEIAGHFSLDVLIQKQGDQKITLRAEHFPTLVLDQTFSISNPKLSGIISAAFGDFIEVAIDQDSKDSVNTLKLNAKSPFIQANLDGKLFQDHVYIEPQGAILFAIPVENLTRIHSILGIKNIKSLEPIKGKILTDAITVPLDADFIHEIEGQAAFNLDPTALIYDKKNLKITSFGSKAKAEKTSSKISFSAEGKASSDEKPVQFSFNVDAPKYALITTDLELLMNEGLVLNGKLKSASPLFETTWKGTIKEIRSEMNLSLVTDKVQIPELNIKVPFIPFQEIFEDGEINSPIQGTLAIRNPTFQNSPVKLDEVTIPWILDMEDNFLKLNILAHSNKNEVIKGSVRVDEIIKNQLLNWDSAALQLNASLRDFDTAFLQPFVSYPIKRILGPSINADITASRDSQGSIDGSVDLTSLKSSEAFIKKIFSKFALQNKNQDITFQTETQQAVGATNFSGTIHNLLTSEGAVDLANAALSLQGNLKHFPVGIIAKVLTGDEKIADTMEAVLGTQVDGEIFAQIKENNGPIKAHLKGLNGQFDLNAEVRDSVLFLNAPITASLKVTPQLEHAVLREYLPLLGSVVSAESPIELTVPVEGFSLPLKSLSIQNLSFQYASLKLGQMQFLKDSPIGKIVTVLGIQTQKFDVAFTPIYFSLKGGMVQIYRTDFLVASQYPMAAWGVADLNQQQMDLIVALSGYTIKRAFSVDGLKNDAWLQIPIRGSMHNPKVDTATLTTRVAALAAISKAGPPGKLIGTVIEKASDIIGYDKVPDPTTKPLPWESLLDSSNEQFGDNPIEDLLEKPVDELKKGAKKIMKNIFQK